MTGLIAIVQQFSGVAVLAGWLQAFSLVDFGQVIASFLSIMFRLLITTLLGGDLLDPAQIFG